MLVGIIRHSVTGLATTLQSSLPSRNLGLSGRFTYGYDSRYLLELNFGYNGSERFSKQHRWGFFPSIGGGWIVSNEAFFDTARSVVNMLKLRASYGLIGNDQIGDASDRFFYISTVDLNNAARGAQFGYDFGYSRNGIANINYENPKIGWEESRQLNLGLDLNVAGVNMVFEIYQQNRSNILLERTNIPASMGLHTKVKANTGKARSRGIDLAVDYSKQFNKNWRATLRGSFTLAQSRFTVYDEPRYNDNEYYRSKIGYAFSQQWGYVADRLFVDDYEVANSPSQARGIYPISGGDIKYRDINRDGAITVADMIPIGYPTTPEINYGFGGTIGYKDFDFSFYFTGLARTSLFIEAAEVAPFVASGGLQHGLLTKIANDHWSEDNRNLYAFWPRLSEAQNENNTHRSTWWMHNGALLRLKSIEMGYNLPRHRINHLALSNLRVYFSGSNLFAISKFKLWDPEMGGKGLGYPVQMVFNLGLSLSL
jgi:TonB-linked SusC/RagA family outer membrane protein